ncbi:hypothetical protein WN51_09424 [Melipona quadrifasciata]|uniref:Uncharacterized protein n=1 Tax=Melipona quadrifasciata TaxID=166423 RepID=A0A0M8ZM83_9HYME|nr:hypothetical protein WN51_09424 [Melipona quadrifasciata]
MYHMGGTSRLNTEAVTLLTQAKSFQQGIIAPKIEISTNTVIEEVKTIYDANLDGPYVVNPKTIDSKQKCYPHRKRPVKGIIRQRKVCHNRAKTKPQICNSSKPTGLCLSTSKATWSVNSIYCRSTRCCNDVEYSYQDGLARISQPYHPMKHDICIDITDTIDTELDPPSRYRRVPSVCGNLHIFDSCPVCSKYKCYFSGKCDKLLENSANSRARLQKDDSAPRQPTSTVQDGLQIGPNATREVGQIDYQDDGAFPALDHLQQPGYEIGILRQKIYQYYLRLPS